MIRPPSLTKTRDDFFSGDPAFIQPPPRGDLSEEEHAKAVAEYETKIRNAKETGNWSDVLVPGAVPTKFVLEHVDRNVWRSILDRGALPADSDRRIGTGAAMALLFRLALKDIVGFDLKVERAPDPKWDGWVMAQPDVINVLDRIDTGIVAEIAAGIYTRLVGLGPLA